MHIYVFFSVFAALLHITPQPFIHLFSITEKHCNTLSRAHFVETEVQTPLSDNIFRRTDMNRQPLSDNILRRTGMNRQPLGDTDSSYVTLCDAMKHHIATTVQIVQHIHSITFPPHMLILQKGYYDYDNIFEAAASIFQSDNSSLYLSLIHI